MLGYSVMIATPILQNFSPAPLVKPFSRTERFQQRAVSCLESEGSGINKSPYSAGTRPTRANVVLKDDLMIVTGGVNYFPSFPRTENLEELDVKLGAKDSEREITLAEAPKF